MAIVAMRKIILYLLVLVAPVFLTAQDDFYPPESFYGGGVGFSQMFLFSHVGQLTGFERLGTDSTADGSTVGLGLDVNGFAYPFVISGGEGFSNITERWRIGGYAGVGSSFIGGKPTITMFLDTDGNGEYDAGTDTTKLYEPSATTGNYAPDLQVKISMWVSGATIEYAFPLFRGLELSAGTLLGIGRLNLSITQTSGSPSWNDHFTSIYEFNADGYYGVTDANGDGDTTMADLEYFESNLFPSIAISHGMSALTGTFLNVQPYLAMKLQVFDRMGLRMTVGYNLGTIGKGEWRTEDRKPITDSPETGLSDLAIRAMIYLGL